MLAGWRTAFFLAIAITETAGFAGFAVSVAVVLLAGRHRGDLRRTAGGGLVLPEGVAAALPASLERAGGRTGPLDQTGALVTG